MRQQVQNFDGSQGRGAGIAWSVSRARPFNSANHLTIGEVSRRYDLTLRALRFYESRGLLHPVREGQTRWYGPRDLVRIELILKGKQLGFTLGEIIAMLDDGNEAPAGDLMLSREKVLSQIEHLERQHRNIEQALTELRRRYYLMAEIGSGR